MPSINRKAMNRRLQPIALLLFLLACFSNHVVVSFAAPQTFTRKKNIATPLKSSTIETVETKDYGPELSSLLGNTRIPASLFAGAAAGAAFAMPLNAADGMKVALVKRIYALLMMGSLSSQLISIIVSTITMSVISKKSRQNELSASVGEYIEKNFDLEWSTTRFHFLSGLITFVVGCGLRAWVSIACPVFAKAALGIITSATLLSVAFLDETERNDTGRGLVSLPVRFLRLLFGRALHSPLYALAVLSSLVTAVYIAWACPHTLNYLLSVNRDAL